VQDKKEKIQNNLKFDFPYNEECALHAYHNMIGFSVSKGRNFRRKTQKGRKKFGGAGEIWGRIFARFLKKDRKRDPNFWGV
jgi:hypothetical protein